MATTKQNHAKEIEIFAGMLNTFTNGLNSIASFKINGKNEAEFVWLLLITKGLHSTRCAIDLMIKGYYSQAMSIIRTIIEDWFICGNAQGNADICKYLLHNEGKKPSYIELATQMNAKKIYDKDYRFHSKFTHSSNLSLRVLTDPETHEMRVSGIYDETLFLLCAEALMRAFLLMTEYLAFLLFYVDKDKAKSWSDENIHTNTAVLKWLEELRAKYGD